MNQLTTNTFKSLTTPRSSVVTLKNKLDPTTKVTKGHIRLFESKLLNDWRFLFIEHSEINPFVSFVPFVFQKTTHASAYRLPITDYRLPITDYRLPITDYRLPITDYRLPITDYRLPITDYRLPITDYRLLITDYFPYVSPTNS